MHDDGNMRGISASFAGVSATDYILGLIALYYYIDRAVASAPSQNNLGRVNVERMIVKEDPSSQYDRWIPAGTYAAQEVKCTFKSTSAAWWYEIQLQQRNYGKEMRDGSCENKQVPDTVVIFLMIFQEKVGACCVKNSTNHQQQERFP